MRKFDLSLRSSRSSYFATFRHQLTILSKTDALDEEKWLNMLGTFVKDWFRYGINTILHELNPLFTINVTMRDIKSKNVYSRVNSKATTQWRKTESANGVHLEGVASDNRSS